jgi:glycosyltransferase involved in cell wall biosynthesis
MLDVSVIIPTFNRLWSLPRAVESCRDTRCQTEIIVVDDGSDDGTWEWLQQQEGIVALRQPNQGQTYAVNYGVKIARGRYIRFLDSDDFLSKGFIDAQFDAAVASEADVVYSRVDLYEEEGGKVTSFDDPLWDDFMSVQLGECYGSHFLGMLFRREVLPPVPRRPEFSLRDDRMFLLEVALQNPKISVVPGCCGYWVQHRTQMQRSYPGIQGVAAHWQLLSIFRRILRELDVRGELTLRRRRAACRVLWPLAHWIAYTHLQEAADLAEWIFSLDPNFHVPERGLLGVMYKTLGFRATERVLRLRRMLLAPARAITPTQSGTPSSRGAAAMRSAEPLKHLS